MNQDDDPLSGPRVIVWAFAAAVLTLLWICFWILDG